MPSRVEREKAAGRNEVFLTLRLPAQLYDDLCRLAKQHFRTASDEARFALYQHVLEHIDQEGEAA